jgi:hypothetical protein
MHSRRLSGHPLPDFPRRTTLAPTGQAGGRRTRHEGWAAPRRRARVAVRTRDRRVQSAPAEGRRCCIEIFDSGEPRRARCRSSRIATLRCESPRPLPTGDRSSAFVCAIARNRRVRLHGTRKRERDCCFPRMEERGGHRLPPADAWSSSNAAVSSGPRRLSHRRQGSSLRRGCETPGFRAHCEGAPPRTSVLQSPSCDRPRCVALSSGVRPVLTGGRR